MIRPPRSRSAGGWRENLPGILAACTLCPRTCRVNRLAGEKGYCGLGPGAVLNRALPHHGEEPPISGNRGAGTLFLSSCNLRCRFCQNHQISLDGSGRSVSTEELARAMRALAAAGCHNIEPVTPTPHLPALVEAVLLGREGGMDLPLVWNCGGYERPEALRLLDGIVDVYLPDLKYGMASCAHACAGVSDYPERALSALAEMVRQVGEDLALEDGIARGGLLVRHLVLPGWVDNSIAALDLLRRRLGSAVPVSIMAQYTPTPRTAGDPLLGRRLRADEYEAVVSHALDLGFEWIFTQEIGETHLAPDFDREAPFAWEQEDR